MLIPNNTYILIHLIPKDLPYNSIYLLIITTLATGKHVVYRLE